MRTAITSLFLLLAASVYSGEDAGKVTDDAQLQRLLEQLEDVVPLADDPVVVPVDNRSESLADIVGGYKVSSDSASYAEADIASKCLRQLDEMQQRCGKSADDDPNLDALRTLLADLAEFSYVPGAKTGHKHVLAFCRGHSHPPQILFANGGIEQAVSEEHFRNQLLDTVKATDLGRDVLSDFSEDCSAPEQEQLRQAVEALADEAFETRAKAAQRLAAAGMKARTFLETGTKSQDTEQANRCRELLQKLNFLRKHRQALETIRHELGSAADKLAE